MKLRNNFVFTKAKRRRESSDINKHFLDSCKRHDNSTMSRIVQRQKKVGKTRVSRTSSKLGKL